MNILDLCRHFGKRYFWPHLLLGIVTASIGIPTTLAKVTENMAHTSQLLPHYQQNLALDHLIAASKYRIFYNCGANYWHQHALRNMIRQLTFVFSAQETQKQLDANLSAHNKPISLYNMLDTFYSIINLSVFHPNEQNFSYSLTQSSYHITYQTALWVAWGQGIRAGP
uniref:Secretion monitor n=1 Tax=Arsenophonus endosymbiont of Trialeurodes vaporariorum TaxID=235567 RepID=A0A3B0MJH7_9GAMM